MKSLFFLQLQNDFYTHRFLIILNVFKKTISIKFSVYFSKTFYTKIIALYSYNKRMYYFFLFHFVTYRPNLIYDFDILD